MRMRIARIEVQLMRPRPTARASPTFLLSSAQELRAAAPPGGRARSRHGICNAIET